mmetsp:Transcript_12982/g.32850  ORF Transcript_12982/g.32850 Transcript_12982/m.32850 type:complete len:295 (+) Transcript_12982:452-1336(+)
MQHVLERHHVKRRFGEARCLGEAVGVPMHNALAICSLPLFQLSNSQEVGRKVQSSNSRFGPLHGHPPGAYTHGAALIQQILELPALMLRLETQDSVQDALSHTPLSLLHRDPSLVLGIYAHPRALGCRDCLVGRQPVEITLGVAVELLSVVAGVADGGVLHLHLELRQLRLVLTLVFTHSAIPVYPVLGGRRFHRIPGHYFHHREERLEVDECVCDLRQPVLSRQVWLGFLSLSSGGADDSRHPGTPRQYSSARRGANRQSAAGGSKRGRCHVPSCKDNVQGTGVLLRAAGWKG